MDDVFLSKLGPVEFLIEIVILLYVFLLYLQDIFEHLIVVMIDSLKYLHSFRFTLFIAFSLHLMMPVQLAPIVMIVYREQI